MTELFGDQILTSIDEAIGHTDHARDILLAFLSKPTSLQDAVPAIGSALQQIVKARASLAEAERIRYENSRCSRASRSREAAKRNGHMK